MSDAAPNTAASTRLGELAALRRYPVKSVGGEARELLRLEARGVRGDRAWALRDARGKLGSGKTTRRFRFFDGLLEFAATLHDAADDEGERGTSAPLTESGPPMLRFPDGRVFAAGDPAGDAALSAWFGEPLVLASETDVPHLDAGPVHLLTSSSLAWLRRMLPVVPCRWPCAAKLRDHGGNACRGDRIAMIGTRAKTQGLAAALALLLAACGGGGAGGDGGTGINPGVPGGPGSPGNPLPSLEGAWSGSYEIGTDQGAPDEGDSRLLVLGNGEYWFFYGDELPGGFAVHGFVQGSGVSASGKFSSANARDFFGILPVPAGTLEASYTTQALLGAARFPGWTTGFSAMPVPASTYDYAAPASLPDIVGLWPMRLLDGTPVDVSIQPDGSLSGEDSSNFGGPKCSFIGAVAPRLAAENVFDVQLQFGPAPCTLPNQVVTGVGITYTIAGTAVRQFLLAGVDGIRAQGTALFGTR